MKYEINGKTTRGYPTFAKGKFTGSIYYMISERKAIMLVPGLGQEGNEGTEYTGSYSDDRYEFLEVGSTITFTV